MIRVTAEDAVARDERWLRWLRMHSINPSNTWAVNVYSHHMKVEQYATRLEVNPETLHLEWRKYCHPGTSIIAWRNLFYVQLITKPPTENP